MDSPIKKPNWLIEIENNSWNPELLISGLSIVFIFSISDQVNDFGIYLVQEYGINPWLAFFLILYLNFAITTLKITFGLHLFLRGLWIGLVGLNYAFPKGVDKQKLSKIQSQEFLLKEIEDPITRILTLEKICSSTFSLAFVIVGISLLFIIILFLASILNLIGLSLFQAGIFTLILFLVLVLPPIILFYSKKKLNIQDIPFLRKLYVAILRVTKTMTSSESLSIFITNTNRYVLLTVFYLYSMSMGIYGARLSERFSSFTESLIPESEFSQSLRERLNKKPRDDWFNQEYYRSRQKASQLIQKSSIEDYINSGDQLELFITEFKWDNKLLDSLQEISPAKPKTDLLGSMLGVSIDSVVIQELAWFKTKHKDTDQRGWTTFIDVSHLEKGTHRVIIDKTTWNFNSEKIELVKGWGEFSFYQNE